MSTLNVVYNGVLTREDIENVERITITPTEVNEDSINVVSYNLPGISEDEYRNTVRAVRTLVDNLQEMAVNLNPSRWALRELERFTRVGDDGELYFKENE